MNIMDKQRFPEDYQLPIKPQDAYDRGLDTQLDPDTEDDFTPTYRDGSACNECWSMDEH